MVTAHGNAHCQQARAEERQGQQGPEQAKPQEAGQALWAKVQVGLRAAIDDARRRGGSSGSADLFTPAQAQEKHTLALRSHNDSFSFRQYGTRRRPFSFFRVIALRSFSPRVLHLNRTAAPKIFRSLRKHLGISDDAYLVCAPPKPHTIGGEASVVSCRPTVRECVCG
jgi:hypothetical protein